MLTAAEVASYLRLHVMTIYRMAQGGELPALRIGWQWRFQRDQIDRWLREHSHR
jgi:excisionase family DNA binding protein